MAVDKIAICNQALAELPEDAISDFADRATSAEWCARLYPTTLAYCIARHDWKLSRVRVALAQITNDRANEWGFAYAIPEDCVTELRVIPTATDEEAPVLFGMVLAPWIMGQVPVPALYRFYVSGTTIYSNIEAATLEYITGDANAANFRPLFERALVLELASRLVMPVKKDRARQGDIIKMAEAAMSRAMADDMNRDDSNSEYGVFTNSTELARAGWSGTMAGFGAPYPLWGRDW